MRRMSDQKRLFETFVINEDAKVGAFSISDNIEFYNMKLLITILMLICSNAFMTFAWYGHLSTMKGKSWFLAALVSWGVAFFEYIIQVPANRVGSEVATLSQLKILQEAISLSVFVPFAILFAKQKIGWNYLWAAFCIAGAVFFIFADRSNVAKGSAVDVNQTAIAHVEEQNNSVENIQNKQERSKQNE